MTSSRELLDYRRIAGFLMAGGLSAVATVALRALLTQVTIFEVAVAVSHVFGLTLAFTLNRLFVFKGYDGRLLPAYLRFFVVNMGSLLIATVTSSVFFRLVFATVEVGPYSDYIAHIIGLGAAAIPSYLGHSLFSFRGRGSDAGKGES